MNHDGRPTRFGRRPFLAAALAGAAGHVLLRPLISEAQGTAPPQRLLLVHRPCGTFVPDWFPSSPGPLGELPPLLQSFEAVKHKMLIVKGVDTGADHGENGDKHAMGNITLVTGRMPIQPPDASSSDRNDSESKTITAASPSFDQFVLQNEPMKSLLTTRDGTPLAIPSIQLAGTERSAQGAGFRCLRVISYSGANEPLWGETRSGVAFDNTLGLVSGEDPADIERARAQRKSVFDFVKSDLNRVRAQVPKSQLTKLDSHLEAIRNLERGIGPIGECVIPTLLDEPTSGGLPGANDDETAHQSISKNMLSIIKACFQCDITRVASLTFADGNNSMRPKMFVEGRTFEMDSDHHGVSHAGDDGDAAIAQAQTDKFYSNMLGQMLAEMDQIPEGDPALGETLLDHTLVIYFSECSDGDGHDWWDMPIAMFGGKFVNLNRGQFVEFPRSGSNPRRDPAIYVSDLWTSLLNAWGMSIDRYGDPAWSTSSGPNAAPGLFG